MNKLLELFQNYLDAVEISIPKRIKKRDQPQAGIMLDRLIRSLKSRINGIEQWEKNDYQIKESDIFNMRTSLWHRDHILESLPMTDEVKQARMEIYNFLAEIKKKLVKED